VSKVGGVCNVSRVSIVGLVELPHDDRIQGFAPLCV
jgi:hypothetical protein